LEAPAKAKYNSDYIVCDKERYIEWLKAWHEADYSLPPEGAEGTDDQKQRVRKIHELARRTGNFPLTEKFKLVIFGEARLYSPIHFPFADENGTLLPNPFFEEIFDWPKDWGDEDISRYESCRDTIMHMLSSPTYKEQFIELLFLLSGFSFHLDIKKNNPNETKLKNCLLSKLLTVTNVHYALHIEKCCINNFLYTEGSGGELICQDSFFLSGFCINLKYSPLLHFSNSHFPIKTELKIGNISKISIDDSKFSNEKSLNLTSGSRDCSLEIVNSSFNKALILGTKNGSHNTEINGITVNDNVKVYTGDYGSIKIRGICNIRGGLKIDTNSATTINIKGKIHIFQNVEIKNKNGACTLEAEGLELGGHLSLEESDFKKVTISKCIIKNELILDNICVTDSVHILDNQEIRGTSLKAFGTDQSGRNSAFPEFMFKNNTINGKFDAENRQFNGATAFDSTHFKYPPQFHGSTLHSNTSFRGCKFKLIPPEDKNNDPDTFFQNAESAFRNLRHKMEEHRSKHEEARFFGLEVESRRLHSKTSSSEKFFSNLYKATSNYGQNIGSCLKAFASWNVCFFNAYFVLGIAFNYPAVVLDSKGYFSYPIQTAIFTLEQIFKPFQIWHPSYFSSSGKTKNVTQLVWVDNLSFESFQFIKLIATTQSIGTTVLFALLLIVIRRKFQLS
jgi:hypothetical protein